MIELYDIVTLEDDLDYAVIGIKKYNNNEYYLLNKVDEEEELIEDPIIVKKGSIDNEDAFLPVTNEQEFADIKNIFADMLFNEE